MIKLSCCIPGGSLMPEGIGGVPESPAKQIVSNCRYLLDLGYDCTECAGGMLADLTPEEVSYLCEENKKSSLKLRAVNSMFPTDYRLADPDAPQTEYLARAEKLFSVMEKLGIRYPIFGSGAARAIPEGREEEGRKTLYGFIEKIADMAKAHGLTLLIEPIRSSESNIFRTVDEAGEYVRNLGRSDVLLLCDAFHMAVEKTDPNVVSEYIDIIRHCHVSDAPKRTSPGKEGGEPEDPDYIPRFAAALLREGYEGAVSIECGFDDFRKEAKESLAYLREVFSYAKTVEFTPIRDLIEEPVYIKLNTRAVDPKTTSAAASGKVFPASPFKEGLLAVLTAKKGETLTLTLGAEAVGFAPSVKERAGEKKLEVNIGGCHFSDYVYCEAVNKPYFGQVKDDKGNAFTRLDLTVKEHPHQRSVFIAVGDVNGVDCWNEFGNFGYVRNEKVDEIVSKSAYASFRVRNRWTDGEGKPLITETSRYTVYNQSEACRALDIDVTFTADYGEVRFGPTKEAGPLGIRVCDALREDIGCGRMTNSWGAVGEGECWSRPAEWCDYYGKPEGVGPMGITVFDWQKNERFPTAWHIRSYGLFAANNLYFKGGFDIPAGESVKYRFRILFRRCEMNKDELSDRFVLYTLGEV